MTTQLPKENFTAVLPVTCNADCHFCPEKEMENKAPKDVWLSSLLTAINDTKSAGYDHISLSGGEPSLDPRLLQLTIRSIIGRTHITEIGMTTNGQFLESVQKLTSFVHAITTDNGAVIPYFINISRHAFNTEENNEIMSVNYKHTMADIIGFRNLLPKHMSFRLNMVLTSKSDIKRLFREAKTLSKVLADNNIDIAFRTDYSIIVDKASGLVPREIREAFDETFGETKIRYSCPTCVTYVPLEYPGIFLKGANFEPTEMEEIKREFIFHQDGILYHDWKRNQPVDVKEFAPTEVENLLGTAINPFDRLLAIFGTTPNPDLRPSYQPSPSSCGGGGCGGGYSGSCGGSRRSSGCGGGSSC